MTEPLGYLAQLSNFGFERKLQGCKNGAFKS